MTTFKVELLGGEGFDPIEVHVKNADTGADSVRLSDSDRSATPASSRQSSWAIDLEGEPTIEVTVKVPRPKWSRGKPKPGQSGVWIPDETESIAATLKPTGTGYATAGSVLHPRLQLVNGTVPGSKRLVPRLLVDLTFLPVTPYLTLGDRLDIGVDRTASRNNAQGVFTDNLASLDMLDPTNILDPDQNRGVKWRPRDVTFLMFELTTAPRPRLWAVGVPKKVSLSSVYHTVLFCLPGNRAYKDGADVGFGSLKRYLLSPQKAIPFFVSSSGNPLTQSPVVNLDTPVVSTPPPGHPLADEFQFISDVTECGFLEQLDRSGKNAILTIPIPHDAPNLGALTQTQGLLRRILQNLRVALASLLLPAVPPIPIKRTKVAVGGFSLGAGLAYQVLGANAEGVNEFYWFDPDPPTQNQVDFLGQWLAADATRALRLVGGKNHNALWALADKLQGKAAVPGNLSVIPEEGFWHTSKLYEAAVSMPPDVPGWQAPKFDTAAPATPGSISEKTGIFESGPVLDNKGAIHGWGLYPGIKGGHVDKTTPALQVARGDLASAALFRFRKSFPNGIVPSGSPGIASFLKLAETALRSYRHQWAVAGGTGTLSGGFSRGAGFIGHLHDCLQRGYFP